MKTNWPLLLSVCTFLAGTGGALRAQSADLLTDLVSYWPLDEIIGTKTPDKVNGYDLTVQNITALDLTPGQKGNGIRFDRTRAMIASRTNLPAEDLPVGKLPSYTIALWTKSLSTAPANQNSLCFFSEGNTTTDTPFNSLRTDNRVGANQQNASLLFAARPNAGGSAILARTAGLPLDGVDWHHIAFVQTDAGDGTATRKFYLDGVEDLGATGTGFPIKAIGEAYTMNATAIGGLRRSSSGSYITADIDEVAVWKRALTAVEVLDLKINGLPPIGPPPDPLLINSFSADFPRVTAGRPVTLSWDVTRDGTITIDPAPGNVTGVSTFGVGSAIVTPTQDTTYTLTLTRGMEPPVTAGFTVNLLPDVAAGWDLLDTFQFRNPGLLNTQYPWRAGQWQVQNEGATGNRVSSPNPAESAIGLPLASRRLPLNGRATLFSRFLIPITSTGDIHLVFGLSDKTVRFGSDWLTNNGPVVRLFRTAGGPAVLQARDGPGSAWTDAALSLSPGTPYNIWIDIENADGVGDRYSVHAGPVGAARTTVFENFLSDRLTTEVPFLGFPTEDLTSLVLATPAAGQSSPVFCDDFFLSTGSAYNPTEPVPSSLTFTAPPADFAISAVLFLPETGDLLLRWNSQPGTTYQIEKSSTPAEALSWNPVQTGLPSAGAETETTLTVPAGERSLYFYRVRRTP